MNKIIFIFLFFANTANAAETVTTKSSPQGITNYGELYLVDQPNDFSLRNRLSLGTGYDIANNFRDVYNIQVQYARKMSDLIEVNLLAKFFVSQETTLKERIDQEFDLVGLQVEGQKPQWSSYLMVHFIPLEGRINFFRQRSIPMMVAFGVGPGLRRTKERGEIWGWQWTILNRFYLSESYSLELNFSQEMEAAFEGGEEKSTRHQLNILGGLSF